MLPKKPIIWFITFVIAIFVTHSGLNILLDKNESLLTVAFMSIFTGASTIGLMYLVNKVRARFFNDG